MELLSFIYTLILVVVDYVCLWWLGFKMCLVVVEVEEFLRSVGWSLSPPSFFWECMVIKRNFFETSRRQFSLDFQWVCFSTGRELSLLLPFLVTQVIRGLRLPPKLLPPLVIAINPRSTLTRSGSTC